MWVCGNEDVSDTAGGGGSIRQVRAEHRQRNKGTWNVQTAVNLEPTHALPLASHTDALALPSQVKAWTNVGFWAGLVPENAGNHSLLGQLVDAGALGFKSFMCNRCARGRVLPRVCVSEVWSRPRWIY